MLTPSLKLYAVPLALLMISVGSGAQTAFAEQPLRDYKTVTAKFAYNPEAPASNIYAKLEATAERVCKTAGPRSLTQRKFDEECAASVVEAAVARIGRTDLATVHSRASQG